MIKKKSNHVPLLFLMGMLIVSIDIINVDLGGIKLKLAYVGFSGYLVVFSYFYGLSLNRRNSIVAIVFLISFLPSLIFSTNLKISIAFYAGTFMCIVIMLTFAKMTEKIGEGVIDLAMKFYRFTVLLTAVLVLFRVHERGHFLFYEASYYAIALIPYYCITFYRMFVFGIKFARIDLILIFFAIILSQSVSMVLWIFLSFFLLYLKYSRIRFFHVASVFFVSFMLIYILYLYNIRVKNIVDALVHVFDDPSQYLNIFILVGGNRLQRVFIAYDAFMAHPWFGVGIGALRDYSTLHFSTDNFNLDGLTASDFSADINATNVFMEVAAEAGIIGLVGFLLVLVFVGTRRGNNEALRPLLLSFYVTMTALIIESSYLRPYVWALYGIIIGISSIRDGGNLKHALMPRSLKENIDDEHESRASHLFPADVR